MLATASQVVTRPSFARASRARDRRRVHVVSISAASSSSASPPGAPAGDDAAPTAPNTPFVSPEAAMRGDVAREWISDVYDAIDYERVMAEADALAADAGISNDDEDAELMYGEFDAGFFVALIESLEPELRALEEGDVDGGAVVNGSFVDIGSGRGQIAVLASVLRTWQRCVGLEYLPVLHAIADQVALTLPDDGVLDDARVACLPNALRQSPLTFIRGDMYDDTDLAAALEGATLVFLFSTKFATQEVFEVGSSLDDDSVGWERNEGTLLVSSRLRPHLRVGAMVVTVNNRLREADGYELARAAEGPDAERTGESVAYVWRVVPVVCDASKTKKTKIVS